MKLQLPKDKLKQIAKEERQRREGLAISIALTNRTIESETDRDTITVLTGLLVANDSWPVVWKANNSWYTIDNAQELQTVIAAVRGYVEQLYQTEKMIVDSIDQQSIVTRAEVVVNFDYRN